MKAPAVIAKVNALAAGLVALPWTMSSATAAIASGVRQSKGDSAFTEFTPVSHYIDVMIATMISCKIAPDQISPVIM